MMNETTFYLNRTGSAQGLCNRPTGAIYTTGKYGSTLFHLLIIPQHQMDRVGVPNTSDMSK